MTIARSPVGDHEARHCGPAGGERPETAEPSSCASSSGASALSPSASSNPRAIGRQIVISEATLARLGHRFETEELAPQSLKGKEHPMRRFRVLRERVVNKTQIYGVPTSKE